MNPNYRTKRLSQFVLVCIFLAMLFLAADAKPAHAGWYDTMQLRIVMKESASNAYISQVKIEGFNQNGNWVTYSGTQTSWRYREFWVPNWWWQVGARQQGVKVSMYLDGYGWRTCQGHMKFRSLNPPWPPFTSALVWYVGNNTCKFYL